MQTLKPCAVATALALLAWPAANPPGAAGLQPPPQILIQDFRFVPSELTIRAGETVSWTNRDEDVHTVVSDDGLFRSPALDTQESFSFTFKRPGTYRFTCSFHPRMTGTIIVQPPK
jgi:plastocyanin